MNHKKELLRSLWAWQPYQAQGPETASLPSAMNRYSMVLQFMLQDSVPYNCKALGEGTLHHEVQTWS